MSTNNRAMRRAQRLNWVNFKLNSMKSQVENICAEMNYIATQYAEETSDSTWLDNQSILSNLRQIRLTLSRVDTDLNLIHAAYISIDKNSVSSATDIEDADAKGAKDE